MDPLDADIHRATRRAFIYWFDDGLQEILVGACFLLIGVFLCLQGLVGKRPPLNAFFSLGFPVLFVGLFVAARRLVVALKDRYVHPRTGYVSFQRGSRKARAASGAVAGMLAAAIAFLSRGTAALALLPAIQGILLAVGLLYAGHKVGLLRFHVQALLCVLAGLGLAFLRLEENLASGLLFAWTGLAMAGGGALALRAYLRQPAVGEEDA